MAGHLMSKLVAEKLNIPWNDIPLQIIAKGKPVLAIVLLNPYLNFNLNITHQGDCVLLDAEPELQVRIGKMKATFPCHSSILEFFHVLKKVY